MNERIKELAKQANIELTYDPTETPMRAFVECWDDELGKFAELIIAECTAVLFDESERLSELYSEETNMQLAEQYEVCSEQCVHGVALIEKHFGVEE